jgi:peptidyl-prolyl cis-trans isomerase C
MKHTLIRTVADEPQTDAFAGCGRGPAPAARRTTGAPPVFVNGVAIAETAIAQEAQNHAAANPQEARAAAARALVIRELLLQRAGALGLDAAPSRDRGGREETGEEALMRQVLELEAPAAEPSEAECRRVYASSTARFTPPGLYEASHILIAPDQEGAAAWDAARERATAAIEALSNGADFAGLARACSACPSGAEGGSLGQLQEGDLAGELERALLALAPGAVGGAPVRTRHGWHVIRLDRRAQAAPLPFETVADVIRGTLRARASVAAAAGYVARLAASAKIEGLSLSFGAPS